MNSDLWLYTNCTVNWCSIQSTIQPLPLMDLILETKFLLLLYKIIYPGYTYCIFYLHSHLLKLTRHFCYTIHLCFTLHHMLFFTSSALLNPPLHVVAHPLRFTFENIIDFSNTFRFAAFSNVYMTMGVSPMTMNEY